MVINNLQRHTTNLIIEEHIKTHFYFWWYLCYEEKLQNIQLIFKFIHLELKWTYGSKMKLWQGPFFRELLDLNKTGVPEHRETCPHHVLRQSLWKIFFEHCPHQNLSRPYYVVIRSGSSAKHKFAKFLSSKTLINGSVVDIFQKEQRF